MVIETFARGGPQVLADGDRSLPRLSKSAETLLVRRHGKYFESAYRQNVFMATTSAASLVIRSVASVTPTFGILNPIQSRKNISLIRWKFVLDVAAVTPVIGAYVLAGNFNPLTAPPIPTPSASSPTIYSGILGSQPNPVAVVSIVLTLSVNPTLYRAFVNHLTGANTTIPNQLGFFIDFDGTCILPPGCSMGLYQLNVDATDAMARQDVVWEEIPV